MQTRVPDEPGLHVKRASFLAACSVVDIILDAKHGRMPFAQANLLYLFLCLILTLIPIVLTPAPNLYTYNYTYTYNTYT